MTDEATPTENPAPTESTPAESTPASNPNADAVAALVAEHKGEPKEGETDFSFVMDKYKKEGRSESDAAMEQAKAYKELQSKFGSFTGSPDEYELSLSEGLADKINLEDYAEDPILDKAKDMCKEMGINNDGFNKLTSLYFEGQLADVEAMTQVREEEMKALGPNADRRLETICDWAKFNMDAETGEKLEKSLTSAGAVEAVEAIIARTRNAPQMTEGVPAEAMSSGKLMEMMTAKDEYGNDKMSSDPEYARNVRKMYSQKYGDEPQNRIVG